MLTHRVNALRLVGLISLVAIPVPAHAGTGRSRGITASAVASGPTITAHCTFTGVLVPPPVGQAGGGLVIAFAAEATSTDTSAAGVPFTSTTCRIHNCSSHPH